MILFTVQWHIHRKTLHDMCIQKNSSMESSSLFIIQINIPFHGHSFCLTCLSTLRAVNDVILGLGVLVEDGRGARQASQRTTIKKNPVCILYPDISRKFQMSRSISTVTYSFLLCSKSLYGGGASDSSCATCELTVLTELNLIGSLVTHDRLGKVKSILPVSQ